MDTAKHSAISDLVTPENVLEKVMMLELQEIKRLGGSLPEFELKFTVSVFPSIRFKGSIEASVTYPDLKQILAAIYGMPWGHTNHVNLQREAYYHCEDYTNEAIRTLRAKDPEWKDWDVLQFIERRSMSRADILNAPDKYASAIFEAAINEKLKVKTQMRTGDSCCEELKTCLLNRPSEELENTWKPIKQILHYVLGLTFTLTKQRLLEEPKGETEQQSKRGSEQLGPKDAIATRTRSKKAIV